MRARKTRLRG